MKGTSLGGRSISFQCLVAGKVGSVSWLAGGAAVCGCRKSGMQNVEAQDESAGRGTAAAASKCRCFRTTGWALAFLGWVLQMQRCSKMAPPVLGGPAEL